MKLMGWNNKEIDKKVRRSREHYENFILKWTAIEKKRNNEYLKRKVGPVLECEKAKHKNNIFQKRKNGSRGQPPPKKEDFERMRDYTIYR